VLYILPCKYLVCFPCQRCNNVQNFYQKEINLNKWSFVDIFHCRNVSLIQCAMKIKQFLVVSSFSVPNVRLPIRGTDRTQYPQLYTSAQHVFIQAVNQFFYFSGFKNNNGKSMYSKHCCKLVSAICKLHNNFFFFFQLDSWYLIKQLN